MQITTLEQAGRHLMEVGVVDFETMTVEGRRLLEVCGFSTANERAEISRQIDKHSFVDGVDFMRSKDATHQKAGQKPIIYQFTMNAANHVLLAAMTEKGKEARQQAIDLREAVDSIPVEMVESYMAKFAERILGQTEQAVAQISQKYSEKIAERNDLIIKKSEPVSLTKILGSSHKVVQAANLWLEEAGYQTVRIKDGKRKGWTITDNGRELGSQVSDISIFWVPDVKRILPPVSELLDYAERLGLKDMKQGRLL